jgi:hypothetical protein
MYTQDAREAPERTGGSVTTTRFCSLWEQGFDLELNGENR